MRNRRRAETESREGGPSSVEVYIGELALFGFPPQDRYRIAGAIEQALTRLLWERGLPPIWIKGTDVHRIDGGQFHIGREAKAETIGDKVAQAVYNGSER